MSSLSDSNLQAICFQVILSNFQHCVTPLDSENYWIEKFFLQVFFSDKFFEKLKSPLTKRHALFLVNQHLRKLDLDRFALIDIDAVIETLKVQGEGILSLHLSNSKKLTYSRSTLLKLANSLPSSLTSLCLSDTRCCDDVLKIVAGTCANLQELDLTGCRNITDTGIKAFLCSGDQSSNKVLLKISLNGTSVTTKSVDWVLRYCPNLKELTHRSVGEALSNIYRFYIDNNVSQFKNYNLETLDFLNRENLKAAQSLCPYVKSLKAIGIKSQSQLTTCGEFEGLKSIVLHSHESVSLFPFLEARGSELEDVTIQGTVTFSVRSLIQFCPKIKRLVLKKPVFESDDNLNFQTENCLLANLRTLRLEYINLAAEIQHLGDLFSGSPNVETVGFKFVRDFTRSSVNVIKTSGISNLQNVAIYHSDIDESTLRNLIHAAPNLKHIDIKNCGEISRRVYENLKNFRNGLSISYNNNLIISTQYF